MANYPPYVFAHSKIAPIIDAIQKATVPEKFTIDFLTTVLDFKSSSDRAIIPLLKGLGFITTDGVPTEDYKELRHKTNGPVVLAKAIKKGYSKIYASNVYAHKLSRDEIEEKVKTLTGAEDKSRVVQAVAATFDELCKLANFSDKNIFESDKKKTEKIEIDRKEETSPPFHIDSKAKKFGISYTINLNLPPTTNVEVFDAIFDSLKRHILSD